MLAAIVSFAFAIRALLATQIVTPWLFVDELVHAELARNLAEHGRFLVRGRFLSATGALAAATLTLCLPAFLLTGR